MKQKKITRQDLVEAVYLDTKCAKGDIHEVLDSLFVQLGKSLKEGCTIELRGFGTFELRLRKGRKEARNPKTGEKLSVAPHYVAVFRPGIELRKSLLEIPVEKDSAD